MKENKSIKEYCIDIYDKSIKRLKEGKEVKLETSPEWQKGFYDAIKNKELAIPYVIEKLKKTYKVSCSVNFGVTDYLIYPNIDF